MAPYVYLENGKITRIPDSTSVNTGKYSLWREGPTSADFIHDDVTPNFFRKAENFIIENAAENKPFFLYLALPSPHTPILPTKEWQGKSGLNPYADFVMMIDSYMGDLSNTIINSGISENTLIIFASDNGCSPAAKIDELVAKGHYPSYIYRGYKADIFEGGHRIPFIVKWPAKIKNSSISDQTICTTDLMATCAELVGYSLIDSEGEDSFSFLPIIDNDEKTKYLREATVHHSINGSFAIRKDEWKLIMCPGSGGWSYPTPGNKAVIEGLPKIQLYNLKNDPAETNNLESLNPDKVNELRELLIKYIDDGRSTPGMKQINDSANIEWKQIDFIHNAI
jgi:arylsulfatase A-like enzyme